MNGNGKKVLFSLGVTAFWLIVWGAVALWMHDDLLLPGPVTVAVTLWRLIGQGDFWLDVLASLLRVLLGYLGGVLLGCGLAALTAVSPFARRILSPFLRLLRTVPVASFIILFMVWFRSGVLPAVISLMMVVPVVWENLSVSIDNTDRKLLEMARIFRFGRRKTFTRVWVPSLMPGFLSACTTGLGLAWKSGVAAEVLCLPAVAIGTGLKEAKSALETPEVLAWTVVVVLLSVAMEWGLKRLTAWGGKRWASR